MLVDLGHGQGGGIVRRDDPIGGDAVPLQARSQRPAETVGGDPAEERDALTQPGDGSGGVEGTASRDRRQRTVRSDDQVDERLPGNDDHVAVD